MSAPNILYVFTNQKRATASGFAGVEAVLTAVCRFAKISRFWLVMLLLAAGFVWSSPRASVQVQSLQLIETFDAPVWDEADWIFTENVERSLVDDGRGGKALKMAIRFDTRGNAYGQISFQVDPSIADKVNGVSFRLKGDGTTSVMTHWLGRTLEDGSIQNHPTIRPLGLDDQAGEWREVFLPLEAFRYPGEATGQAVHIAFILTQRISDAPAEASTFAIDDIALAYDPDQSSSLLEIRDDREFFASLDLGHAGLAEVEAAVSKGDYDLAAERYARYMQLRRGPTFYLDYSQPDRINQVFADLYQPILEDATFRKTVDEIMAGTLRIGEVKGIFPEGQIDWTGESQNLPWTWSAVVQRMQFLPDLGKAYIATGENQYLRRAWDLFESFNTQWPAGRFDRIFPKFTGWHHGIGVAERTISWVWAYEIFRHSDNLTAAEHIAWQGAIFEHAQWLQASIDQGFRYTNQQIVEAYGLLCAALIFPESKYAEAWMDCALGSLIEHMEREVLPDGAFVELVPGYHNWMADSFLKVARLLMINDIEVPEFFMNRAEKMYAWTGYAIRPDGRIPAIGDGSAFDQASRVAVGAAAFGNPEFKFLSHGRTIPSHWFWFLGPEAIREVEALQAEKPSETLYHAEHSNLIATRTGWGSRDHYLLFNAVMDGGVGHGHPDGLAVNFSFFGRSLLADPGTLGYAHPNHMNFFKKTRAHSVLMGNGAEFPNAKPELLAAESREGYDYFHGRQTLADGRQWERQVWFLQSHIPGATIVRDRAMGEGTAKLELIWRLERGLRPILDTNGQRFSVPPDGDGGGFLAVVLPVTPNLRAELSLQDGLPDFEGKPLAVVSGLGWVDWPQEVWTVFLPVESGANADAWGVSLESDEESDTQVILIHSPIQRLQFRLTRNENPTFRVGPAPEAGAID